MANIQAGAAGDTARARMNPLDWVAIILLIVGGVNWALVGLFGFDLVAAIFGSMSMLSRIVYVLVGLAALYSIYFCIKKLPRTVHPA
ncbi:MAG TPA: DUF378 domain-containing protein [Janthinobacterium sp.]|nr:DUF378 domain-containing protein [Janthinobacterium sp.]